MCVCDDNDIYILDWINKKRGYLYSSKKYPQKFKNLYNINFEERLKKLFHNNILSLKNDTITITDLGKDILRKYSYIIWIEEHRNFDIGKDDFLKHPYLNIITNNDVAYSILQQRNLEMLRQIEKGIYEWEDWYNNFYRISQLLYEEKKYEQSLDNFIIACYLQFSGLKNNNSLIILDHVSKKYKLYSNSNNNFIYMNYNIKNVRDIVYSLNLSKHDFISKFEEVILKDNSMYKEIIPFHYFNICELAKFIADNIYDAQKKYITTLFDLPKNIKLNIPDKALLEIIKQ